AQSFHWMDRDLVAATILDMLETGGAFVQISATSEDVPEPEEPSLYPAPPAAEIEEIKRRYLGPERRAGQGVRPTSPSGEAAVLARAGYDEPQRVRVTGREPLTRSADDIVAHYFSQSQAAPHLFG